MLGSALPTHIMYRCRTKQNNAKHRHHQTPCPSSSSSPSSTLTLLYPINTSIPASSASSFIFCNSATVGAPGFSKYIHLHFALIHSVNNFGLSAVRPLINATRGCCGSGNSATDEAKIVPWVEVVSVAQELNSGPPGPVEPGPRNQGSMT